MSYIQGNTIDSILVHFYCIIYKFFSVDNIIHCFTPFTNNTFLTWKKLQNILNSLEILKLIKKTSQTVTNIKLNSPKLCI